MNGLNDVSEAWERNAKAWLWWARSTGRDVYFWDLNLPAFESILPTAGRRTLDIGCGEGRLGRRLGASGHRVSGIDSSPTLVQHALDAGAGGVHSHCPLKPAADGRRLPGQHSSAALLIASFAAPACTTTGPRRASLQVGNPLPGVGLLTVLEDPILPRPEGFPVDPPIGRLIPNALTDSRRVAETAALARPDRYPAPTNACSRTS